jgi:uncharacterized protein YwqG
MAFELMVFERSEAPMDWPQFVKWSEREERSADQGACSRNLKSWFQDMSASFPQAATLDAGTLYTFGESFIKAEFSWKNAEEAISLTRSLAEKRGLGFCNFNSEGGDLEFFGHESAPSNAGYDVNRMDKKLYKALEDRSVSVADAKAVLAQTSAGFVSPFVASLALVILSSSMLAYDTFRTDGKGGKMLPCLGEPLGVSYIMPLVCGWFLLMAVVFAIGVIQGARFRAAICKAYPSLKPGYGKKPKSSKEVDAKIDELISRLKAETFLPAVVLTAAPGNPGVFGSKLGGTPCLPKGFAYPKGKSGRPLRLLAQLNFEELPPLPDFPTSGILQFYIADDDLYGADFDNPNVQSGFRIAYHDRVSKSVQEPPVIANTDDSYFPFDGEFALSGALVTQPMPANDFRFEAKFLSLYKSLVSSKAGIDDIDIDTWERVAQSVQESGHRIGGYPFFTQEDPRRIGDLQTVLLLQVDSIGSVCWGDAGVANFFISPEKLKARDFSDVSYNWDCC